MVHPISDSDPRERNQQTALSDPELLRAIEDFRLTRALSHIKLSVMVGVGDGTIRKALLRGTVTKIIRRKIENFLRGIDPHV